MYCFVWSNRDLRFGPMPNSRNEATDGRSDRSSHRDRRTSPIVVSFGRRAEVARGHALLGGASHGRGSPGSRFVSNNS